MISGSTEDFFGGMMGVGGPAVTAQVGRSAEGINGGMLEVGGPVSATAK